MLPGTTRNRFLDMRLYPPCTFIPYYPIGVIQTGTCEELGEIAALKRPIGANTTLVRSHQKLTLFIFSKAIYTTV
jgi:hypothetical protein